MASQRQELAQTVKHFLFGVTKRDGRGGGGGEGGGVGWSKIYIFVPEPRKPTLTFLELNEQEGCKLCRMFLFALTDGLICHLVNEI